MADLKLLENELFVQHPIKKNFKALSEAIKTTLKNAETAPKLFDLLKNIIKTATSRVWPSFKYFLKIFTVIRQNVDLKKYQSEYLTLVIVYARKYTTIHFDDVQKQNFEKLNGLFSDISTDTLVDKLVKSGTDLKLKDQNLLTYIIVYKRKQPERIQEFILQKLTTDFLIDIKKHTASGYKFSKLHANLFTPQIYKDQILPGVQKLVRRSELNMKVLLSTLMCNIDYSEVSEEVILKNLKDFYQSKDVGRMALAIAQRLSQKTENPVVQELILEGLKKHISSTNSEDLKFEFLAIITSLAQASPQKNDQVIAKIIEFLLDNLTIISTEPQYLRLDNSIQQLFKNVSENFKIEDLSIFTKRVSTAKNNKFGGVAFCRLFTLYVQSLPTAALEAQKDEILKVAEQINTEIFKSNLKDSKKLVTNSFIFVASLESISVVLPYSEAIKTSLNKDLPSLLVDTIFTCKKDFFSQNSTPELTVYTNAIVNIYYAFSEEINKSKQMYPLVQNILIFLLTNTKVSSQHIIKMFKKADINVFNMLQTGLFYYLYLAYHKEFEHFQSTLHKILLILNILLTHLSQFEQEKTVDQIKDFTYFNFLINNTFISKPKLIKKYKHFVKNNKETLIETLKTSEIAEIFNSFLLNSPKFIQNSVEIITSGTKGIAQIILDLEQYNILLPYKTFLEKENYENSDKLAEFQQKTEEAQKIFTEKLENPQKESLISLQILKPSPADLESLPTQKPEPTTTSAKPNLSKKPASKKPAGKPPKKSAAPQQQQIAKSKEEFLMLDEEELLAKKLREHKQNMFRYYQYSVQFLELLGNTPNAASAIEFFFQEFMNGFLELCHNAEFHKLFRETIVNIFGQMKSLKEQREALADFTIKYSENDLPNDKIMNQFNVFQENILKLPNFNEELPEYLINYIHLLQKYVLTRTGFSTEIKQASMNFYIKLDESKYLEHLLQIFAPINNNLNIIASYSNTEDLLNKLVKNLKNVEEISQLFRDILNNMDKAKLVVLKCLFNNSKTLNFQPTFDDIIKLRILIIDENPTIRKLAEETLEIFPHEIDSKKIKNFDLDTFVLIHSKENTEKFTKFAFELMTKNPEFNKVFFQKLVSTADALYHNEEISEESLLFFPHFLDVNMQFITAEQLEPIFTSLVQKYTLDGKEMVSKDSLQKGIDVIQTHGPKYASHIIQILEKFLKSSDDQHQLSSIIYLGVIAPYIKNKASVEGVSQKIMNLFEKGSQNMQKNLARCMPELINFFDSPKKIAQTQLNDITFHSNPIMKRGCCYLVAGLNKGLGVGYIQELQIFDLLKQNSDLKKDKGIKEATLYLIQAYIETFERVIEPYITEIAEIIMLFFTDRSEEIRDLALDTIKLMMKKLTSFGVKIVLPQMLKGLEEPQWQAKCNNIWSLGNMAYCSAKQLSQCLPQIVPKLSYCLSDTHPKIREAANESLNNIGSTIQNPEISQIVDILIQALSDPFEKNKQGLKVLLQTKFEHYIDAPSLSLVIPILDYALKQKHDADAKIDACQVIGSISALIKDITDILPYMNILVQGIASALGDPESDVRTFGAKAVGKMAFKLGMDNCSKYFKFIQDLIENEGTPSIERGGAASAQAEIMCALGGDYFKVKLAEIFTKIQSKENHMKEGYIGLFVYLPLIMKGGFQIYIKAVLENIVEYVTYDFDKVRDVALRVLKIMIQHYGISDTELLMQPIMDGMFSTNWRKRNSAIVLSGEMLEVLAKYLKVAEGETLTKDQILKTNYRNQNVMGIYILRSDENDQIRHSATNIWKSYVDNTPKTMKQALDVFLDKLIYSIMLIPEIAMTTIKCVKDFAGKYGESFFPQIMQEVQNKIDNNKENLGYITGLLMVLREIMLETNVIMATRYKENFIQLLKTYLFTQDKRLREAVFKFYKVIVDKITSVDILENIVSVTYKEFQDLDPESSSQYTDYLEIFNNICRQKSQKILTYIIPFLFATPMQMQQVDIITNNAEIVGKEVYRLLDSSQGGCEIMLEQAFICQEGNLLESLCYCLEQLSINLQEEDMIKFYNFFMEKLRHFTNDIEANQKQIHIILSILAFYYYNTQTRINYFNDSIIQQLLPLLFLEDKYYAITQKTNTILQSFYNSQDRKVHYSLVSLTCLMFQNHIEKHSEPNKEYIVPGLNCGEYGSGVSPYVDMIISCLVFNSEVEFDKALELIEYLVKHSTVEHLNIHIMKIVGPLIRVINYKYEQERKEVIVHLLSLITDKKMNISCFNTQLQSTYLKLITEFPREEEFVRKISSNVVKLMDFCPHRRDLILHQVHHRFRDESNNCVKHAYIVLIQKYIKTEVKESKNYFARALLEKLFDNFTKIHQKDKLNNNILFCLVKLVGYLSSFANLDNIQRYQESVVSMLEDGSEEPLEVFYELTNLIAIYLYNPNFTGESAILNDQEEKEAWKAFRPIQNVQQLLEKNINKFDKELLTFFVHICKKCIKKQHTIGKYLQESINFSQLEPFIDQELLQFPDIVALLK